MSRWFRFYADAIRNPKVAKLTDFQFRLWVELMSVAAENDGHIPPISDLKHVVKRRLDHLLRGVNDLITALLIDPLEDGYEPHNWRKFQYKSDTSTSRVHKHREKRNVSETPPDTETDTETETDTPQPPLQGGREYAFSGHVIRLDAKDLEKWRKAYSGILDIEAELSSIDAWWTSQPMDRRKKWFHSTAGMLNKRHQEAKKVSVGPQPTIGI